MPSNLALKDTLKNAFKAHANEASAIFDFQRAINEAGLKSESVAGVMKTGAIMAKEAQGSLAEKAEKQAKERASDVILMALLNDLERELADVRERRMAYEEVLIEEYGEDFIVDMAERFLDPEIVERLPGESEEDYRARLEQELEDLMLNDDGSIKPEYDGLTIALWLHEKDEEESLELERDELLSDYNENLSNGMLPQQAAESAVSNHTAAATAAALSKSNDETLKAAAGSDWVSKADNSSQATANTFMKLD